MRELVRVKKESMGLQRGRFWCTYEAYALREDGSIVKYLTQAGSKVLIGTNKVVAHEPPNRLTAEERVEIFVKHFEGAGYQVVAR